MNRERFDRVRALFLELRAAGVADRDARLEQECNGDTELRDTVRRLLDADSSATPSFLDAPVMQVADALDAEADAPTPTIPERIDRYRLVRLLGAGSVGDVYLAEQDEPVARAVALKLLRPASPGSLSDARFRIEREALAKLSHQNIAGILDAGRTREGRPYLVVELVPGERLDDYLERNQPSVQARLRLFLQLCSGVQHAHQRGVVHRDLKPANVLVIPGTPEPTVKIVDFGITKLLSEQSGPTITSGAQLLGTLAYMSPEQLDPTIGAVDARSDVYALGVILYRILSGRMPRGDTGSAALQSILAGTPCDARPLSEAPRQMRRDLETIVRRAMEREPDQRYDSAAHMADDVRRVLDGEPILARRASLVSSAIRLARKNPWTIGMLAASLSMIVTLAAVSTSAVIRLDRQVREERDMLAAMLDESVERIRRLSGAMEGRRAMAESLLTQTDRLLESRPRDFTLLLCRARILDELSDIAMTERDAQRCRSLRKEAVAIYTGLSSQRPFDPDLARRYAESLVKLGDLDASPRNPRGAEDAYMRALALHESLAERWPDHPGVLDDLCWSYERVSTMHSQLDDPDAAREYARKAVRVGEDLIRRWPERSLSHHAARGALLRYYATFQSDDDPESWLALDMASKFAEEALRLEPDRLDFIHARARVRQNFVEHFLRTGMHAEAAANARAMLADAERLARENPARRDLIEMSCRARVLLAEAFAAACHSEELENAVRSGARMIFNEYPDTRYPELLDEALCYLYRLFDRSQQMRAIPRL